jgi:hypothetical protein
LSGGSGLIDAEWERLEGKKYAGPVIDIVADLPKEDLAALAESLVNLTSFKRRISREAFIRERRVKPACCKE